MLLENQMESILTFDHVTKRYGNGVCALKDVSLSVHPGEFISIIGPSGSGKSTLLRSINKLISTTEGNIFFDGENVSALRGGKLRKNRSKIGMIFQNYNLVYNLSVLQNVLHGRLGHMSGIRGILGLYPEADKEKAWTLLEEMGLEKFGYNKAGNLSGGQKQRVGIARAIIQDPKILLCDEPIASLDPSSAKVIMDLLKSTAQKRGIPCLVNLHQVDVAMRYSTRIIGLHAGEIVFDGEPESLSDSVLERIYGTSVSNLVAGVSDEKDWQQAYAV